MACTCRQRGRRHARRGGGGGPGVPPAALRPAAVVLGGRRRRGPRLQRAPGAGEAACFQTRCTSHTAVLSVVLVRDATAHMRCILCTVDGFVTCHPCICRAWCSWVATCWRAPRATRWRHWSRPSRSCQPLRPSPMTRCALGSVAARLITACHRQEHRMLPSGRQSRR